MIISIIVFSIIIVTGIVLIFSFNTRREAEYNRFVKLTNRVEDEIHGARMIMDRILLEENYHLLPDLTRTLDSVALNLTELSHFAGKRFDSDPVPGFENFRTNFHEIIQQIETIKHHSDLAVSEGVFSDTSLLHTFSKLSVNYKSLKTFIPVYLYRDTVRYKQELIGIIVFNLILNILAGVLILKLLNRLIVADRTMIHKAINVENRERERIAADLHDGLGSLLSGLIIHIQVLEKEYKEDQSLLSKLSHLHSLSTQALQSIEIVINNLNSSLLARYGLIKSLEQVTDKLNELGKTQFSVHAGQMNIRIPESIQLSLYRICSELINNALKHSSAEKAEFNFSENKKFIHLVYKDNGIGFDKDVISYEYEEDKGGLYNLVRRVESMGGTCTINSGHGKGVEISIIIKAA